ncbi:histidinol dehydrogenase, partial [Brucella melitensis]|uniref:histidinol dehydrogenase n=1 Tax=Brucella melitensis TaxID=29459 RepID=UPI0019D10183
ATPSPPNAARTLPTPPLLAAHIPRVKHTSNPAGPQAVAPLPYRTDTINRVDNLVGPGNLFVALAQMEVSGDVDIDMIAGPSEIAVLADETANANEVAADLLSQAEHDTRASAVLVTTSQVLAEQVSAEVEKQLSELPRKEITQKSIEDYG